MATRGKLRAAVATLDDRALEALASKGLLRRAQKDLEKGLAVEVVGEDDAALTLRVGDRQVTIPEAGPARAKCTCPALGTCQHVLAACLHLRRSVGQQQTLDLGAGAAKVAEPAAGARKEVLAFTIEQLTRWAGKAAVRGAATILAGATPPVIEEAGPVVAFPEHNVACRFVSGGGLDGVIVAAPLRQKPKFAVAAVLAYQRAHGRAPALPADVTPALTESAGAPRSRAEVLDSARRLLAEMVTVGLSHLSPSHQQRASTLAVSALGVNLPRLALLLRGAGDETKLLLHREAQADEGRLLLTLARGFALTEALSRAGDEPRADLVGWHRTRYEDVGNLDLCGIGAYVWRTASGYRGLTVLFWDDREKKVYSWSEARPEHLAGGFKPAERFRQEGPWQGAASPDQVSRSCFKLMQAKANAAGRLSASARSRAMVTGPTEPPTLQLGSRALDTWSAVRQRAAQCVPVGLGERRPLDEFVVLRPAKWGRRTYDPVNQALVWELLDGQGDMLPIELRHTDENKPAIEVLEALDPVAARVEGILGRAVRSPRGWTIEPVSLLTSGPEGPVVSLGLDGAPSTAATSLATVQVGAAAPAEVEETEELAEACAPSDDDAPDVTALQGSLLARSLVEVEGALQTLAERGVRSSGAVTPQLAARAREVEGVGLGTLALVLRRIASCHGPQQRAAALLRASYVADLHRQAAGRL